MADELKDQKFSEQSTGRKIWLIICFPFYMLTFVIILIALLINAEFYPDFFKWMGFGLAWLIICSVVDWLWMRLAWGKWDKFI
jgi:hypothetical protein